MAEGQEGGFNMLREVQDLADKFKEDDEQYISPYAHLEKAAVLQEARYVFYPSFGSYGMLSIECHAKARKSNRNAFCDRGYRRFLVTMIPQTQAFLSMHKDGYS